MNVTTTEHCPFCNSPNIGPTESTHPHGYSQITLSCDDCGATGPVVRAIGSIEESFSFAQCLFAMRRGVRGGDGSDYHWQVVSTCLGTGELMVVCTKTGAFGVVPSPTDQEWARAFFAPSHPYPWPYADRVILKREGQVQPA